MMGRPTITHPAGSFGKASFAKTHELVKDGEFKFEFNCVNHGFNAGFAGIFVTKLKTDKDDIHADTDRIDEDELQHHLASHAVVDRAKDAYGVHDVQGGNEKFLETESNELYTLHDVESRSPWARMW